jgi:hypothetical protein
VERLEAIIKRMDDAGTTYEPDDLRDVLYRGRDDLDTAIDDIEFAAKGSSDELRLMAPDAADESLLTYGELSDKIRGVYTAEEVEAIAAQGRALGMTDRQITDFLEMGAIAKPAKGKAPLTPGQLEEQMTNWITEIRPRGYPYLFESAEAFESFKSELKALLNKYGVPEGKIELQGSALRTAKAKDVDVAIFVSDDVFEKYAQRCADGIKRRANPDARDNLLSQLNEQTKDGYISQFYFDRVGTATFPGEARSVIGAHSSAKKIDVSVMTSSSKLALYPSMPL